MTDEAPDIYDVLVLGGGSGGYACALRSAQLGLRVALIERDKLGGTCLHRGCIPTKALLHAADVADTAHEGDAPPVRRPGRRIGVAVELEEGRRPARGARFGVNSSVESIDMLAVLRYQQGVVSRLHKGLQGLISAATIDYVDGFGEVTSPTTVRVGDRTLTGRRLVLATGSRARSLPGPEIGGRVLTSDQALGLTQVPTSVIVLGGGVIGVEFASVFRSFGASVTIIEALPRLVPAEEESISKALERAFRKRGIVSRTNARFASVAQDDASVTVSLEDGSTLSADLLLVAVGREPVSDGMGFQEAGVHTDRGFVPTDERLRTNIPGVSAVGASRLRPRSVRRRGHCQLEPRPRAGPQHPQGHLLRPRDRQRRSHRSSRPGRARRGPRLRVQPRRQRQVPDPRDQRIRVRGESGRRAGGRYPYDRGSDG